MDETNVKQNQPDTGKSNDEIDMFEIGSRVANAGSQLWTAFKKLFIVIKD
jgi:hypothetical protein